MAKRTKSGRAAKARRALRAARRSQLRNQRDRWVVKVMQDAYDHGTAEFLSDLVREHVSDKLADAVVEDDELCEWFTSLMQQFAEDAVESCVRKMAPIVAREERRVERNRKGR